MDSGVEAGSEITPMYDPMVAKLIVWDADRDAATKRMQRALRELEVGGVKTLIPFHIGLLGTEEWAEGGTCRNLIEDKGWLKQFAFEKPPAPADDDEDEETVERTYAVEVSGRKFDVKVIGAAAPAGTGGSNGAGPARKAPKRAKRAGGGGGASTEELVSPLQGTILKVAVEKGATVEEGALICVIEAMKMENEITAHRSGTIEELAISEGASITSGDKIAVIK
jgi:acetyl-CoA/propionyl-CoA carboxylase biotin carboxyl carrier protein